MSDHKFTQSGFKYPERIYGQNFQSGRIVDKPALLTATKQTKQVRFSKFGVNLGPERPVKPVGKHSRERLNQSPLTKYRKEETQPGNLDIGKVN